MGQALAAQALRVIWANETLFEAEELLVRGLAVVEDIGGLTPEVDFDAPEQERKGIFKKAFVILEGHLAGVLVNFDDVGFIRVAINAGGAKHVDAQDGGKFWEEAAMNLEGVVVLAAPREGFAGGLNVAGIPGGEEEFAGGLDGRFVGAEKAPDVALEAVAEKFEDVLARIGED